MKDAGGMKSAIISLTRRTHRKQQLCSFTAILILIGYVSVFAKRPLLHTGREDMTYGVGDAYLGPSLFPEPTSSAKLIDIRDANISL
jgi:hypothetical protein